MSSNTEGSSSSLESDSGSDDDEVVLHTTALALLDDQLMACQVVAMAYTILFDNGRDFVSGDSTVNPLLPSVERLGRTIDAHGSMFRSFTGFTFPEWEILTQRVCPVIQGHARHSGLPRVCLGRRTKLSAEERLLSFVIYVKHNSGARPSAIDWNYSRTSLNANGVFVASAINMALADDIQWPDVQRRAELGRALPDFPGCIGHIDGTLCKIRKPHIDGHKRYHNRRKAMYCFNNVIIVDHDGLIIYVDAGFAGSFHDLRCLRSSPIFKSWRQYFTRDSVDEVPEYLLSDPGYLGIEMFILRHVDFREVVREDQSPVVEAFNKRHAACRVQVEWGIGGLKNRWRRFLDICPSRRRNFAPVFEACYRLTNFVHRSRLDFSITDVGVIDSQDGDDEPFVNEWGHD